MKKKTVSKKKVNGFKNAVEGAMVFSKADLMIPGNSRVFFRMSNDGNKILTNCIVALGASVLPADYAPEKYDVTATYRFTVTATRRE